MQPVGGALAMTAHPRWHVAIFCANEAARVAACLASVATAMAGRPGTITVVVNGSTDGSDAVARAAATSLGVAVRIVRIPHADKSNAINFALYNLGCGEGLHFFVDGYVTISPNALQAIATRLEAQPDAVAASGVATSGRTEPQSTRRAVAVGGVLRGQFFALRPGFVRRIVDAGIRLPVGLYRGDGLLGSMAAHDLDAVGQPWLNSRVVSVAEAAFTVEPLSPFRLRDVRRQFRRKVRQMRGMLENAAVKQVIYASGYAALPPFADDMIRGFLAANPAPSLPLLDRPFMALALRQHRAAAKPDPHDLAPADFAPADPVSTDLVSADLAPVDLTPAGFASAPDGRGAVPGARP